MGFFDRFKKVQDISVNRPQQADIRKRITTPTQLYRSRQGIAELKAAITNAESLVSPQRQLLYKVYQNIVLDSHLTAAINQRKNLTMSLDYDVVDKDGNENEELEKIIEQKWFRDLIDFSLDSIFWGYSLVQFDSIIEDSFKNVELVPREYVKPELHIVTQTYADLVGTDYLEAPFRNWCIGVGKPKDLGLLMKAAPLIIWKTNAMGAWSEYIEVFGTPIRIGRTNVRDEETRANMEAMLRGMGTAAYGVFDTDDLIELVESNKTDAYNVFDMMVNRCNSEISKLILGQTATMDEKSFVGSAEVQERVLQQVGFADEVFIENVLNGQLVPMLSRLGIWKDGFKIKVAKDQEFTLDQKSKFDIELLKTGKYKFTAEYLLDNYGADVIEVIEPTQTTVKAVKNSLERYYK